MQVIDDMALLREYAERNSEAAFETLVSRHIGLVHSMALRQARDPLVAEEITQTVFVILSQKAGRISNKTILTGWLFKTTRFTALAHQRAAAKRRQREQEADMQSELKSPPPPDALWEQMSPLLDEALAGLGEKDRQAVLLRYFENKNLSEVGGRLGMGEDTARKRVSRALEKLRRYFSRRGVIYTTAIIAGAISANSVQAAPGVLAKSVTSVAVANGTVASGSTLALIKGTLKLMAWTKAKIALAAAAGVLLIGGTTTVLLEVASGSQIDESVWENIGYTNLDDLPQVLIIQPSRHPNTGRSTSVFADKMAGVNTDFRDLLMHAYTLPLSRMVLPPELVYGDRRRFDFMVTVTNHPHEQMQALLIKKFGLTIKREIRETDVLLLKVKRPDAPGLALTGTNAVPIRNFVWQYQAFWGKPVLDQTGLTGQYVFKPRPLKGKANDAGLAAGRSQLQQDLLDQLGLEFVPAREPIEMLIVEKAK